MVVAIAPVMEHYIVMVRARLIAICHIHTLLMLKALKKEQKIAVTDIYTLQMKIEELLNKICCNSLLIVV